MLVGGGVGPVVGTESIAGHLEEHVVEGRGAQGEIAHGDGGLSEGDGDRADGSRTVKRRHHDGTVTGVDHPDPVEGRDDRRRSGGVAVDPGLDQVVADLSLQLGPGCPRQRAGRRR